MKSKIILAVFMGMVTLLMVSSCNKDEGRNNNTSSSANIGKSDFSTSTPQTFNPSNSQLLIVPIPFYDNMFHFPNMASFNAVKKEISEKPEEYKAYFIWRDLNFSSFDKVTKASELISDDISESEMNLVLQQFNITVNEENEVAYKYNLLYKNLILNNLGLVEIGSQLAQFDNGYMYLFNTMNQFELFLEGRAEPEASLKLNMYASTTYNRSQNVSCGCRSSIDLGGGLKCLDRRVKGTIEVEQNGFTNNTNGTPPFGGCNVTYDCEGSTVFQKKVFGIWWNTSADQVKVTVEWCIFNNRGGNDENICCDGPVSRSLSNNSNVQIFRTIDCGGNWSPGRPPCTDERDPLTNGVRSAVGIHTAKKAGKCNSLDLTCTTPNCI
jgi:hypothetical protein